MVERIALFKLQDEYANPKGRAEVAAFTRQALGSLPGVRALSVGTPADDASEKSWDLSIVLRFDSLEDVQAYVVHPEHRKYVDEYMRPRMQVVKAWNFEIG